MTRCDCCAVTLSLPIEQFGPVGVTLCAECWLSFGEGQSRGLEIVEEEMEAGASWHEALTALECTPFGLVAPDCEFVGRYEEVQQWEPDGWVPTNWDSEGAY